MTPAQLLERITQGEWIAYSDPKDETPFDWIITSAKGVIGYWFGGKSRHTDNFWRLTKEDALAISLVPLYARLHVAAEAFREHARKLGWIEEWPTVVAMEQALAALSDKMKEMK